MQLQPLNLDARLDLAAKHHLLGKCGFEYPNLADFSVIKVVQQAEFGNVRIKGNGRPNYIAFNPQSKLTGDVLVTFARQASDNLFIVADNVKVRNGKFNFFADRGTIYLGSNNRHVNSPEFRIWIDDSLIFFGNNTTSNHLNISSKYSSVVIGEDCMFATDVWIRNSDEHLIFDLESLDIINPAGEVIIYPHTWICQDALILKNAKIGIGSIVGAKSIVNKDVPHFSLVAGNPAKILKNNVSWERNGFKIKPDTLKRIARYKKFYVIHNDSSVATKP